MKTLFRKAAENDAAYVYLDHTGDKAAREYGLNLVVIGKLLGFFSEGVIGSKCYF